MGGNGKTPMVEYLIRILKSRYRIAVLSRGYGRVSSGFKLAQPTHTAADIGDEPLQIYHKFSPEVEVAVGESRALAIPNVLLERPEVELIILDDAFQHREVDPQFSILVTDYYAPFFQDYVIPSGMLRESRKGVSRADVIVVTKCPSDISIAQRESYQAEVRKYHTAPVFFTTIAYQQPIGFTTEELISSDSRVLLITGIAKPKPMIEYVSNHYALVEHLQYQDHHNFNRKQVMEIKERFEKHSENPNIILTTEKDMVRLTPFKKEMEGIPIYYLPIECEFIDAENKFNSLILNTIESVKDTKPD